MLTIADIAQAAQELGIANAERDVANGIEITPEESSSRTMLGMLFDGAPDELYKDAGNRVTVGVEYRHGYALGRAV